MVNHNFKKMAEDLERLLASTKTPTRPAPAPKVESAAPAPQKTATKASPAPTTKRNTEDVDLLARSIIEYSFTKAPNTASAPVIGEAIAAGLSAAVSNSDLSSKELVEAVDRFLASVRKSVMSALD